MKPPMCVICGKRFDPGDNGDVIYFALRDSDKAWHDKMEQIGGVGHPPEAEWFCEDHLNMARELKHKTIDEAIPLIFKHLSDN